MDRYTMIVALSGQFCGTLLLITLITAFVRRRQPAVGSSGELQRIDARLSEMQQSLDAVAVEVERISEGQRFATKLLTERGATAPDANGAREILRHTPAR